MIDARTPPDPASEDWFRPLLARQVEVLGRLAEAGLKVALAIEKRADAVLDAPPEPEPEQAPPAEAERFLALYPRVARAVRLSLMLQEKVIRDLRHLDQVAAHGPLVDITHREILADRRRDRVTRIVGRVAEREAREASEVEHLTFEAAERLEHGDLYGDVLARPISDLVAQICHDLGLEPDWPILAQEAWALDEMASESVGLPLLQIPPPSGEGNHRRWWRGPSAPEASDDEPPNSS